MSTAEIIRHLARDGYRIGLTDDGRLSVIPRLATDSLRSRVVARKAEIVAYLRELGAPAATEHAFVALADSNHRVVKEYGVCLSCGNPWSLHGEPPVSAWERVNCSADAALLVAAGIVVTQIAERIAAVGMEGLEA